MKAKPLLASVLVYLCTHLSLPALSQARPEWYAHLKLWAKGEEIDMRIITTGNSPEPSVNPTAKPHTVPMVSANDPELLADIEASQNVDISACESVCLALGPYRNLTTLTAATLFLHPDCQVLNHAGVRIYASSQLDFFKDFSTAKFERFMRYAVHISAKGERGDYGGSIVHSHAFDDTHSMKQLFANSGGQIVKQRIKSLFWKESLLTSNQIRERQVDFSALFAAEKRLRFLLPIRNPMDCAFSNLKSTHVKKFEGISQNPDLRETTQSVLKEIVWVAELQERFPERFFMYFEHGINREMLMRLASFLQLTPHEKWLEQALSAMKIKQGYSHDPSLYAWYRDYVPQSFLRFPALSAALMKFLPGSN